MDVVVFPRGEGKGKDWQWEFHLIPFGMEGTLPGKPHRHKGRLQREEEPRMIASKHSEGRRKHEEQIEQTGLQQKIIEKEKGVKGEGGGFMFYFSQAKCNLRRRDCSCTCRDDPNKSFKL